MERIVPSLRWPLVSGNRPNESINETVPLEQEQDNGSGARVEHRRLRPHRPHQYYRPLKHEKEESTVASVAVTTQKQHDLTYYALCVTGGICASSIRWINVPLDVVKTNMQVYPGRFAGVSTGIGHLYVTEGLAGLFKGLNATAIAYGLQVGTKYGLYEFGKDQLTATFHDDNNNSNNSYFGSLLQDKRFIYMVAAGTAECVADVLMCPWEMIKVRMQTNPQFPSALGPAVARMWADRHATRFPFGTLSPLLIRQVPGTIINMLVFETCVEATYKHILGGQRSKSEYAQSTQLLISLSSGFVAGALSAAVSHPADSLVSLMGTSQYKGMSMMQVARTTGLVQLATRGLLPRMMTIGSIVSFQWLIYDSFKTAVGLETTGGEQS